MNFTSNKGISLIEMLLVLVLIAVLLPVLYQIYFFGQETFGYSSRFIRQQYIVTNTLRHIRGDIQSAATVKVSSENTGLGQGEIYPKAYTMRLGYYGNSTTIETYKFWRFYCGGPSEEGKLQYGGSRSPADTVNNEDYIDVVKELDIKGCKFERQVSFVDKLIVWIKPKETNQGRVRRKNMEDPIITEISVLYKDE